VLAGLQARESRNYGSVLREGNKFMSPPEHPDWHCKQPILLSGADQWLFLLQVKQLANIVLKLRMSGEIPPLPYAFMVYTGTTLISRKLQSVHIE
jgi:hypothetical protein